MKTSLLAPVCVLFILLADCGCANPYYDDKYVQQISKVEGLAEHDYSNNAMDRLAYAPRYKRSCIPRGYNCDHRMNGCCSDSSSCRCNLWGANCRCQRRGLF